HVDDQHVEWNIVVVESANQVFELQIAVRPVTRPPCAECESRRQGNLSSNLREVAERLLVVVPVSEKGPVLAIARRPLHHTAPGTVFALREAEVGGIEERA